EAADVRDESDLHRGPAEPAEIATRRVRGHQDADERECEESLHVVCRTSLDCAGVAITLNGEPPALHPRRGHIRRAETAVLSPRSGDDDAPHDVRDEHDVQTAAEHERG